VLEKTKKYIDAHNLLSQKDRVLIGISGGRDSTVLTHVLTRLGYNVGLAHMNYRLRAEASDEDEKWVRAFASQLNVPLFVEHAQINTPDSLQTTAREHRYAFFKRLLSEEGFHKVALAHHHDDRLETLFLNLMRGTGIHGMRGMPVAHGAFIRPLLWANRSDIDAYVKTENLHFREDESNEQDTYLRNRIRHHLIPLLSEIDPSSPAKLLASMDAAGSQSI